MPDRILQAIRDTRRGFNLANAEAIFDGLPEPIQDSVDHVRDMSERARVNRDGFDIFMAREATGGVDPQTGLRYRGKLQELKDVLAENERIARDVPNGNNPSQRAAIEKNRREVARQEKKVQKFRAETPRLPTVMTDDVILKSIALYCANGKTLAPFLPAIDPSNLESKAAWEADCDALADSAAALETQIEDTQESPASLAEASAKLRYEIEVIGARSDKIVLPRRAERGSDGRLRTGRPRFPVNVDGDPDPIAVLFGLFAEEIEAKCVAKMETMTWGDSIADKEAAIDGLEVELLETWRNYEALVRAGESKFGVDVHRPATIHPLALLGAKVVDAPVKVAIDSKLPQYAPGQRPRELIEASAREKASRPESRIRQTALDNLDAKMRAAKNEF